MISETIINDIIPFTDLGGVIPGLEELQKLLKSNKIEISAEIEKKLSRKLEEARKELEEYNDRRFDQILDYFRKEGAKIQLKKIE